jgi:hypothetical protein
MRRADSIALGERDQDVRVRVRLHGGSEPRRGFGSVSLASYVITKPFSNGTDGLK